MLCSVAPVNSLPVHNDSVDYIFWSFGIIGFILSYFENRKLVRPVLGALASVAHFITGHE